jgi:hypothetical protein
VVTVTVEDARVWHGVVFGAVAMIALLEASVPDPMAQRPCALIVASVTRMATSVRTLTFPLDRFLLSLALCLYFLSKLNFAHSDVACKFHQHLFFLSSSIN